MGKVKITWREGVKEKLHEECGKYFKTLPDETITRFFNIILNDTKKNT